MNLDLSKLSRIGRYNILSYVEKLCTKDFYYMSNVIKTYEEGDVKNEMIGWMNAYKELAATARKMIAEGDR